MAWMDVSRLRLSLLLVHRWGRNSSLAGQAHRAQRPQSNLQANPPSHPYLIRPWTLFDKFSRLHTVYLAYSRGAAEDRGVLLPSGDRISDDKSPWTNNHDPCPPQRLLAAHG